MAYCILTLFLLLIGPVVTVVAGRGLLKSDHNQGSGMDRRQWFSANLGFAIGGIVWLLIYIWFVQKEIPCQLW